MQSALVGTGEFSAVDTLDCYSATPTAAADFDDGTKDIKIERHWWGSKEAGSPTLYRDDSYSTDAALKPLKYIIAPGVA